MTTMTHPDASRRAPSRIASRAILAIALWASAAIVVVFANRELHGIPPAFIVAVKSTAIVLAGFAYVKLSRDCSIDHALAVGTGWLLLGIVAEVSISATTRHTWFALLGSPAAPYLRDVLLFFWVAAPALFARRWSNE